MHIPLHLNLLSLALFSPSALTMTIPHDPALQILNPATTALPTNSTLNSTSPANANRLFTCAQQSPHRSTRPGFADCAGVLRSLPLNPSIGIFYNAGPGDFQLPYFNTYKSCQVLVELQNAYDKVRSSWYVNISGLCPPWLVVDRELQTCFSGARGGTLFTFPSPVRFPP